MSYSQKAQYFSQRAEKENRQDQRQSIPQKSKAKYAFLSEPLTLPKKNIQIMSTQDSFRSNHSINDITMIDNVISQAVQNTFDKFKSQLQETQDTKFNTFESVLKQGEQFLRKTNEQIQSYATLEDKMQEILLCKATKTIDGQINFDTEMQQQSKMMKKLQAKLARVQQVITEAGEKFENYSQTIKESIDYDRRYQAEQLEDLMGHISQLKCRAKKSTIK